MNKNDAIAFIQRINKEEELQAAVRQLAKRDWPAFFTLAQEYGCLVDHGSFHAACLSDEIVWFCPALIAFAGHLFNYKM